MDNPRIANPMLWASRTPEEHKAHRTLLKEDAAVATVAFASFSRFGMLSVKYPLILRTHPFYFG